MKFLNILRILAAATGLAAFPLPSLAQVSVGIGISVGIPPPAIPVYQQPFLPGPNYIWVPGYWAWSGYGYYWVPGTWTYAPQPGYLWTPGYWGWNSGAYAWNAGYWGASVGFYGGIDYGFGYFGQGYSGGVWAGNAFRYNTFVNRVNTTIVRNVYFSRNVYVNRWHAPYNGGPHGVPLRPTPRELVLARGPHVGLTPAQREHIQLAAQDRRLLANVNHGHPPYAAVARPLGPANRPAGFVPVRPADRMTTQGRPVAASHPAPARPIHPVAHPVPARPVHPVAHPAPVHAAPVHPVVHAAPVHPVVHAAPVHPMVHAAPVHPAVHAAPVHPVAHPAPAHPAPAMHGAPPHPAPAHPAQPAGHPENPAQKP